MYSPTADGADAASDTTPPPISLSSLHEAQVRVLDERKEVLALERRIAQERRRLQEEHLRCIFSPAATRCAASFRCNAHM